EGLQYGACWQGEVRPRPASSWGRKRRAESPGYPESESGLPVQGHPELPAPWRLQAAFKATQHGEALRELVEHVVDTGTQRDFTIEVVAEGVGILCVHDRL